MKPILVLMWKHLKVRMRRFIHTPVEIISPVIFFILIYMYKDLANPTPKSFHLDESDNIQQSESISLDHTIVPPRILYTPDTELTGLLMGTVGEKLRLQRLKYMPDHVVRGYYPFTNESSIIDYLKDMKHDEAVVIFQGMSGSTWPEKLNYTIRMKTNFMTHRYESLDGTLGPHERFGTIYEPYLRLQWAIDTSYIQLLTNDPINQSVYLQEFPYAKSKDNTLIAAICIMLTYVCLLSLLLVFVFLMVRLLEERTTGIQELIKMVGVSSNVLGISHFLNVLPTGLVYSIVGAILLKASSTPIIPHTNGVLIFLTLALHFVTVIAMAFACSYLARGTQYTVALSITAYIALWTPARLVFGQPKHRALVILSGLLPHAPMQWFWNEVSAAEQYGRGLSFADIAESHSFDSGPVLLCYTYMIIQAALFFLLSWYLALVRPGKYGQALPWNFFCQGSYWNNKKVTPDTSLMEDQDEDGQINSDPQYFEEPPKNTDVGIKICNVSKVFPKHRALSNVSLDVYKGEITVLLGHNGAGKTTLMSIITGMLSATEGKVYVNGMDTVNQQAEVRKHLGLCPQHNLFFPDLTVLEHVMFFTLLKGGSFSEAHSSSMNLLEKLGLHEKSSSKSAELSGGMKRRLQLSCALAGGASVLILDEPTSGLDVETRRGLWDLLLSLRGDRTVLLTTHFMEEADALGDRVAALHAGRLRCHATTMYLKRAVGTGYRLSFTTIGLPNEPAITSVVTAYVSDATVKEKSLNSISYNLPARNTTTFPAMFGELETKRSELGVDSIGVGKSTLEEVFLQLCSDTDTTFSADTVDSSTVDLTQEKVTGFTLYTRQLCVLLKRQINYILSKKISFLTLQVLLPIILICLFTKSCNDERDSTATNRPIAMNLDIYKDRPERRALYHVNATGASLRSVSDSYPDVEFVMAPDVASAVLRTGQEDILEYNKYLVGIELNDTDAKVLYTTVVRHAAPVALNLLSNVVTAQRIPRADGRTITAVNHPLDGDHVPAHFAPAKSITMLIMWAALILFIILSTLSNAVSLPCKERASGARHIHIMSGCPPALHWAAALIANTAVCVLTMIVPTLVAAAALDTDHTLTQPHAIGALFVVLLLGCLAFFAFTYLISFDFGERTAGIVLVSLIIIFGFITPTMKAAADILKEQDGKSYVDQLVDAAGYVFTPHAFTMATMKCVHAARLNALCSLNRDQCPNLAGLTESGFDTKRCCETSEPMQCYFCISDYSPWKELIILAGQFIVYMTLVILAEMGFYNIIMDRVFNIKYTPEPHRYNDEMVRAEKAYVEKAIALPKNQIPDAMLVHDVHKKYSKVIGKSCNAVKGISFSVKKGECFGLLGVNGAGKSTTFKMLTAEECATRGKIYANGNHLTACNGQYLRSLGYCPQFFGLDHFQTGKENLTLLLTLRGMTEANVKSEVDSWINVVGLERYMDRAVSGYSGGCVRRLATAAALSGGAPLTLLDEPTAGVDVSARRRVWAALRRGLQRRRAVVITSHSMDEMEALCGRIAMMSNGEICALGEPAALRAAHAAGHAVVLKLSTSSPAHGDVVDSAKSEVLRLKATLQEKFNCSLKDEHKTMLHYHINETMRYSDLFTQLEAIRSAFPALVEDYSVTETTLEEVFLSFAKDAQQDQDPSGPIAV